MRGFGTALAKDLRLLARDRVGLAFLGVAPIIVITVAGLSLANLYGPAPGRGTTFPLVLADEDGGEIGRTLGERLEAADVPIERVASGAAARARVGGKTAGAALVVRAGTSEALAGGRSVALELLTDPVKSVEVAVARSVVQELRHAVESAARDRMRDRLAETHAEVRRAEAAFAEALEEHGERMRAAGERLAAARAEAVAEAERAAGRLRRALAAAAEEYRHGAARRIAARLAPLVRHLAEAETAGREFERWLDDVRREAGRFADRMPPPPAPPTVPSAVTRLGQMDAEALVAEVLPDAPLPAGLVAPVTIPSLPRFEVPALPRVPAQPTLAFPGTLLIDEQSVTGAPKTLNTFDQNVPGFGVTFLLLGMLLGVSLGLLEERDWGTLGRLATTPTPVAAILTAKLASRGVVGLVQMGLLFGFGRLVFGVSLGPEPWALLLPTVGITAAGTAFGLVVAGLTRSREAVLPAGSIVILTMAAAGGCWWPIDLEPPWMRTAALAFPTTWAMDAYNDLMIRGRTARDVLPATAVLLAHATGYLALGLLLFRRLRGRT